MDIENEDKWDDFKARITSDVLSLSNKINLSDRAWDSVKDVFEQYEGGMTHTIKLGLGRRRMTDYENPALKESGYTLKAPSVSEVCVFVQFSLIF